MGANLELPGGFASGSYRYRDFVPNYKRALKIQAAIMAGGDYGVEDDVIPAGAAASSSAAVRTNYASAEHLKTREPRPLQSTSAGVADEKRIAADTVCPSPSLYEISNTPFNSRRGCEQDAAAIQLCDMLEVAADSANIRQMDAAIQQARPHDLSWSRCLALRSSLSLVCGTQAASSPAFMRLLRQHSSQCCQA